MRCDATAALTASAKATAVRRSFTRRRNGCATACATAAVVILLIGVAQPFRATVAVLTQSAGLGRIEFPTSGSAAAQPDFVRAVAALHNFEYDEAVAAFRRARQLDPAFAMAYWGEALAHHSTLASSPDVAGARAVLHELAPTRQGRLARARTDRERGFLEAIEILFGGGTEADRQRAYVSAMERLHGRYPEDNEVASFYALALLDTAIRATYGLNTDSSEGSPGAPGPSGASSHQHAGLAGSDAQRKAGEILRQVLERNPQHPGAAHYLLHNYDDAEHAARALDVARTYARIAPESSHARHMPAHIFVQLGLWHDAAESDEAASRAAETWAKRRGLDESRVDYHPLTWLQYERLQLGQFSRAREMLEAMQAVAVRTGSALLRNHAASMRARYAVETRRWDLLRDTDDFGNLDELVAIGISAARAGNVGRADQVRDLLGRLATGGAPPSIAPALTVMQQEVAGLVHVASGRADAGIASLRSAAEAEQSLPTGMGPPRPIKPAQELLGEVLLETGRQTEAREAFERALQRNPNRSASVLGLARAATAAGDRVLASRHYAALVANWSQADGDLAELREARAADAEKGTVTLLGKEVTVPFFAVVALGVVLLAAWRRHRTAAPARATGRRTRDRAKPIVRRGDRRS